MCSTSFIFVNYFVFARKVIKIFCLLFSYLLIYFFVDIYFYLSKMYSQNLSEKRNQFDVSRLSITSVAFISCK